MDRVFMHLSFDRRMFDEHIHMFALRVMIGIKWLTHDQMRAIIQTIANLFCKTIFKSH